MTESNGLTDLKLYNQTRMNGLLRVKNAELEERIEALEAENAELRQTLDTVWQDLHTIKSHIQIAIRHKSS